MDRDLFYMAALMIALGSGSLLVGCKTAADKGPKPFVMPSRPVLNLPPESTGASSMIPSSSTGNATISAKRLSTNPADPVPTRGMHTRAN